MAEVERRREEKIGCSLLLDNFLLYSYLAGNKQDLRSSATMEQMSSADISVSVQSSDFYPAENLALKFGFKSDSWLPVLASVSFIRELNRGRLLSELGFFLVNSEM